MSEYINQLSAVQREAATKFNGPSLVIAGAGSGKTRVLTCRIAYMVAQGVDPNSILALTFTNKAAREMKERIASVVDPYAARRISMGTFHSVFSRILRAEAEHIGFEQSFTIYETADSTNLVKTIIKEMKLADDKYKPKEIFSRISLMKNSLTTPTIYVNQQALITDDIKVGRGEFAAVYREYMRRCKLNGAMDFDDLLLYTNNLFKKCPDVLAKYQQKYKYILVDEYQDTNYSQYLIIKKIAEAHENICVVGDDAQSIYSFRGAKIENILRFQEDYPRAVVHKLEQNYRSTQTIVAAANSVIARNSNQLKKEVFSKNEEGELITITRADGDRDEAMRIAADIAKRHEEGLDFSDIAILYRANSQSKSFEDQLRAKQIPYRIYGGISFYQRAEIKNIISYVRLCINSNDDEAFKRVLNFPQRGIGITSMAKIEAVARTKEISMWEAAATSSAVELNVSGGAIKRITEFVNMVKSFKEKVESVDIYDLVYDIIYKAGIVALYKNNPLPESQSAYENVEELINSLKIQVDAIKEADEEQMLTADNWLRDVTLLTDMDEKKEGEEAKKEVTLMTIHASKGLEYNTVYIVGVEEGSFPSSRSVEDVLGLEEERRLFYVAMTRAVKSLVLSFATTRYKWGAVTQSRPSRFLKEVDTKYLDAPELLEIVRKTTDVEAVNKKNAERRERYEAKQSGVFNEKVYYGRRGVPQEQAPKRVLKTLEESIASAPTDAVTVELQVGDKVTHKVFGAGVVEGLEPFSGDIKVTVNFESQEANKTLLMKFAKLEKITDEEPKEE